MKSIKLLQYSCIFCRGNRFKTGKNGKTIQNPNETVQGSNDETVNFFRSDRLLHD